MPKVQFSLRIEHMPSHLSSGTSIIPLDARPRSHRVFQPTDSNTAVNTAYRKRIVSKENTFLRATTRRWQTPCGVSLIIILFIGSVIFGGVASLTLSDDTLTPVMPSRPPSFPPQMPPEDSFTIESYREYVSFDVSGVPEFMRVTGNNDILKAAIVELMPTFILEKDVSLTHNQTMKSIYHVAVEYVYPSSASIVKDLACAPTFSKNIATATGFNGIAVYNVRNVAGWR